MTRAREIADLAGLVTSDSTSIAWDTSTLYIDATNNRVGVLTTSPTKALDLRGSLGVGNSTAVYTSLDPVATNDSNGGFSLSTLTSSSLTEKARLTSTGRLGIGTTSPDTLLHIKSTDNAGVTLESTDGSRKWLIRNNQGTNDGLVLRNATAGTDVVIIDDGAGANSLVVDSSGNVAIGGTDADVTLDMSAKNDAIHLPTGNTSQRPSAAEAGMFRYNSETSQFEGYTNAWGAIAGGGGVDSAAVRNIFSVSGDLAYDSAIGQFSFDASTTFSADTFTGDDSTAAFTLSQTVSSENHLIVFNEGVFQNQSAYVLSGTTLTFDSAPASGNTIVAYQVKNAIFGNNLNLNQFTGDDSTAAFTLSLAPIHENNTQVYIDGVYQQKNGYTTSGTTLTFDTAPPTGSTIEVMTMTQTDINTAKILQDGDLDTKIQVEESTDEDKIRFDIAGTEKMIIDSTGVGIGTSSPTYPLHVYSSSGDANIHIETTNAGSSARLRLTGSATGTSTLMFADENDTNVGLVQYDHTSNFIKFNVADSEAVRITDNADFLINTSTIPTGVLGARQLILSGSGAEIIAYNPINAISSGDRIGAFVFGNDDNNATEDHFAGMWAKANGTDGNMDIHFAAGKADYEADTPQMTLDKDGNVGIGGTPQGPYAGQTSLTIDGGVSRIDHKVSGTRTASVVNEADYYEIQVDPDQSQSSSRFLLAVDGSNRIRVDADGLKFGTDTASANALNDYEAGTWTPILAYVGGGTKEYTASSINIGRYVKIGDMVFATGTVGWSGDNGGTTSSYVAVKGLPFSCLSTTHYRAGGSMGGTSGLSMPTGFQNGWALGMDAGDSHVYIMARSTTTYTHNPTVSASGAIYGFNISYRTT